MATSHERNPSDSWSGPQALIPSGGTFSTPIHIRVEGARARIPARPGWTRAVVVTHEPVLRLVMARCQGLGLAGLDAFEAVTASISIIDCAPGLIALEEATLRLANGTNEEAV